MDSEPQTPADKEPEVADASLYFRHEAASSEPPSRLAESTPATGESGYDLQAPEARDRDPAPRAPNVPQPRPTKNEPAKTERLALEPSQAVEEVWSRWGEWGASLALLVAASALLAVLLYFALGFEAYGLAVFLFLAGGILLLILGYPILITLERPVRVTPEQAVNDYYSALSHHAPHFRRMWLLLSRSGRTSGAFASFDGFRSYWRARFARLRGDRVPKTLPLKFQVTRFKAAKSAGLSTIVVSYHVEVFARGRTSDGPLATFRIETSLVKGPDRMWYLDVGTLPEA